MGLVGSGPNGAVEEEEVHVLISFHSEATQRVTQTPRGEPESWLLKVLLFVLM